MASTGCILPELPVNIQFMDNDAASLYGFSGPEQATSGSAGFDLRACLSRGEEAMTVSGGERIIVPTGIAIEPLLQGVAGFVYSRSGLGAAKGLTVAQGVGVIDPDYRGEIFVYLLNTSSRAYTLEQGERIAQLVFQPFYRPVLRRCEQLSSTERGAGGFGHTGR